MTSWPEDPAGDMTSILKASIAFEEARQGKVVASMTTSTEYELTEADRCDKACPAAAIFRLSREGLELDLCAHHWRELEQAMGDAGWVVACQRSVA